MSARGIVTGVLHKAETLTSKAGRPYVRASIRDGKGDAAIWWTAFVFSESAIAEAQRLAPGEPISVAGEIEADLYVPPNAQPRVNLKIAVDAVLSARPKPRPKAEKPLRGTRPIDQALLLASRPRRGRRAGQRLRMRSR